MGACWLRAAVAALSLWAAPSFAAISLFTGPGGTNPVQFPAVLPDLNNLIQAINPQLVAASLGGQIDISPTITITGAYGPQNSGLWDQTTLQGQSTLASIVNDGQGFVQPKNTFDCPYDKANTNVTIPGSPPTIVTGDAPCGFFFMHLGGGNMIGGRDTLRVTLAADSQPLTGGTSNNYFYSALLANTTVSANMNGTGPANMGLAGGQFYGIAAQTFLQSGATWIGSLFGSELDVGAASTTANVSNGSGIPYWLADLVLVSWNVQQGQAGIQQVHGSNVDAGIWMSVQAGDSTGGFRTGILFDTATSGFQAIWNGDGLGTYIYSGGAAVFRGVDFSSVTCSGSGAAYLLMGANYRLDCSGNETVGTIIFSGTMVTNNTDFSLNDGGNGQMFGIAGAGPTTAITAYPCFTDSGAASPTTILLAVCGSVTDRSLNLVTNGAGLVEFNGFTAPTTNLNNTFTGSTNTFTGGVSLAGSPVSALFGAGLFLESTDSFQPHGFDASTDRGAFALICAINTCAASAAVQTAEVYMFGSTAVTPTTVTYGVLGTAADINLKLQTQGAGLVLTNAALNLPCVAFASHGTSLNGDIECFNNSVLNTFGAIIVGGGANQVLGWYNGANWTVIGQ